MLLDNHQIPLQSACQVCGASIEPSKNSFVAAHTAEKCPLSGNVPQLLSLLQHLTDRLHVCRISDVLKVPQLQRLMLRKALLEMHLEKLNVLVIRRGNRIVYYEYQESAGQENNSQLLGNGQLKSLARNSSGKLTQKILKAQNYKPPKKLIQALDQSQVDQTFVLNDCLNLSLPASLAQPPLTQATSFHFGEESSDDEYETFLTSLLEEHPQRNNRDDLDDPMFPADFVKRRREPPLEYRDDDDTRVTNDELLELFEIQNNLPEGTQSAPIESPYQDNELFSMDMYNMFINQMRQNFQLVVQGLAVSKEFYTSTLQTHEFWVAQYNDLKVIATDKLLNIVDTESGQSDEISWIPLLNENRSVMESALLAVQNAQLSPDFMNALNQKWNSLGQDNNESLWTQRSKRQKLNQSMLPYPNSLSVLLKKLTNYCDKELIPEWSPKDRIQFRDIEDVLLLQGLNEYGAHYSVIRDQMLPHRATEQVMNRARNQGAKRIGGNWQIKEYFFNSRKPLSEHEQQQLQLGVKDYGNNFTRISVQLMPHRTPGELRRAFALMYAQWNPPRFDYAVLKRVKRQQQPETHQHQHGELLIIPEEDEADKFVLKCE